MRSFRLHRALFPFLSILLIFLSVLHCRDALSANDTNTSDALMEGDSMNNATDLNATTAALDARSGSHLEAAPAEAFTPDSALTDLKFSDTQAWDPELIESMNFYNDREHGSLLEGFVHEPFPLNTSPETEREIAHILDLQSQLDEERIEDIKSEIFLPQILKKWRESLPASVPEGEKQFIVEQLGNLTLYYFNPIIARLKEQYDRVRPMFLNDSIKMVIEAPKYAAYPSGHATITRLHAHLLSHFYPESSQDFFELANNIAVNREYAGIHFLSDTKEGVRLADHLYQQGFKADEFPLYAQRMAPFLTRRINA